MINTGVSIAIVSGPAKAGASQVVAALDSIRAKSTQVLRGIGTFGTSVGNKFRELRMAMMSIQGAMAGVGIAMGAATIIKAGFAMDAIKGAIEAVSTSLHAAGEEFQFVNQIVDKYGSDIQSTASAYSKLYASARTSNFEVANTRAIFLGVVQAGTALRLTTEQMEGALLAISQMISKGSVMSEELKGQLAERIPGAFGLAAKAMGKTTLEFGKMLEMGQVASSEFLPKFAKELQEAYGEGSEKASKQAVASFNRMYTAIFRLSSLFATSGFNEGLAELTRVATQLFDDLIASGKVEQAGSVFRTLFTELAQFLSYLLDLFKFTLSAWDELTQRLAAINYSTVFKVPKEEMDKIQNKEPGSQGRLTLPPIVADPFIDESGSSSGEAERIKKAMGSIEELIKTHEYLTATLNEEKLIREDLGILYEDGVDGLAYIQASVAAEKEFRKLGISTINENREAYNALTHAMFESGKAERELEKSKNKNEKLASLTREKEELDRLIEARRRGEESYIAMEDRIKGENEARKLGLPILSQEYEAFIELNTSIEEQVRLLKNLENANSELNQIIGGTYTSTLIELLRQQNLLNEAMQEGVIDMSTYAEASEMIDMRIKDSYRNRLSEMKNWQAGSERAWFDFQENALDASKNVETAFNSMADGMTDVFTDFFTEGTFNLKTFEKEFLTTMNRMLVQRMLIAPMMSMMFGEGGSGGIAGGFLGKLFGGGTGSVKTAANGGIFTEPTVISEFGQREAAVPLPGGREIPVNLKGGGGASNYNFTIITPDADSFRKSQSQIMQKTFAASMQNQRRNGGS